MSLFPEVDKEISEIKRDLHKYICEIKEKSEIYKPSNGSDTYIFIENYCEQCPNNDGEDKLCPILGEYSMNGRHDDIRIDKDGYWFCFKSPMFLKIAEEKFYRKKDKHEHRHR